MPPSWMTGPSLGPFWCLLRMASALTQWTRWRASTRFMREMMTAPPGCSPLTLDRLATPWPVDDSRPSKMPMFWDWAVEFFKAVKAGRINQDSIHEKAGIYANSYGTPGWEFAWRMYLDGQLKPTKVR